MTTCRTLVVLRPLMLLLIAASPSIADARHAPTPPNASTLSPFSALSPSSARLSHRANELLGLFTRGKVPERLFAPGFLTEVPVARVQAIAAQLVHDHGRAIRIDRIDAAGPTRATLFIRLERAIVRTDIEIEGPAPHRIVGLLFAAVDVEGDGLAAIAKDMAALAGRTSLTVARLGEDGGLAVSQSHDSDQPLAVASAFKLFLLAELARAVAAGERTWSGVVPLGDASVSGGVLQPWPVQSPLTLHSLAALMIARSDNRASDTLLALLGRERVEALLPSLGVAAPERLRPLLSTREAALLKAGPDASLGVRWVQADEAGRRALLAGPLAAATADRIAFDRLMAAPTAIDSVEWFATTIDLVRVMNWLRLHAGPEALAILAINGGVPDHLLRSLSYVGYKGGSEPGVLNMTFLIRTKQGDWHAVSASWNDASRMLDEFRFELLVRRVLAVLSRKEDPA